MEHDIYDSLRRTATFYEQLADALNAIAEWCEKVTAHLMDLFEEIKSMLSRLVNSDESRQQEVLDICMTRPRQPLKMILQKLRPDYKDKCKIRWLNIPNKVMQGRIRRFC
jgi:Cdc6-like AAA superfamily ATPase